MDRDELESPQISNREKVIVACWAGLIVIYGEIAELIHPTFHGSEY